MVIEIKLARNAEARRAVVAQVLTYAAHLKGLDPTLLEENLVDGYLREHKHESLRGTGNDERKVSLLPHGDAPTARPGREQACGRVLLVIPKGGSGTTVKFSG